MRTRLFQNRAGTVASLILCSLGLGALPRPAHAFGGENILSTKWRDWHHNVLCRFAAEKAGFTRKTVGEADGEEPVDSAAAEIAWHADFLDGYAYNPLYWGLRGRPGIAAAVAHHPELIKLHFDDLYSTPQVRWQFFQYTTGTIAGLAWAKTLYDSGKQTEGIAAARHILGVSLHAMQDLYSHSNWVDAPNRRDTTWFAQFTTNAASLVATPIWTGSYEHPAQLGMKPHGYITPTMSALQQVAPIMDAISGSFSPLHDLPICENWRKFKENKQAIQPGILPSGPTVPNDALLTPPSQSLIKAPEGTLYVAPAGIALDTTWLCNIAVQQRGLSDVSGPVAFQAAYTRAFDASVQWLQRVDKTMTTLGYGTFWTQVKTAPPTTKYKECFEDFNQLGFQFISAGDYPPASTTAQGKLTGPNAIPPKQYFLRLKIKTSGDTFSGTDSDIALYANGKETLLDYYPVQTKSVFSAIIAPNDFEAGSEATYTVGPFDTIPTSFELRNKSANFGDVAVAVVKKFVATVVAPINAVVNLVKTVIGSAADYVGQARQVWQWSDLEKIGSTSQAYTLYVDGGNEGKYHLYGSIHRVSETADTATFEVHIHRFHCDKRSKNDRLSASDEPFFIGAVCPLPGAVQYKLSAVYGKVKDGSEGVMGTKDGQDFVWTVTVPKKYGAITVPVCVMESDDESENSRRELAAKFAGAVSDETEEERESLMSTIGRATAADWKIEKMEVLCFSKGGAVEMGTVFNKTVNQWIDGGKSASFPLTTSAVRPLAVNVLDLQRVIATAPTDNNPNPDPNPDPTPAPAPQPGSPSEDTLKGLIGNWKTSIGTILTIEDAHRQPPYSMMLQSRAVDDRKQPTEQFWLSIEDAAVQGLYNTPRTTGGSQTGRVKITLNPDGDSFTGHVVLQGGQEFDYNGTRIKPGNGNTGTPGNPNNGGDTGNTGNGNTGNGNPGTVPSNPGTPNNGVFTVGDGKFHRMDGMAIRIDSIKRTETDIQVVATIRRTSEARVGVVASSFALYLVDTDGITTRAIGNLYRVTGDPAERIQQTIWLNDPGDECRVRYLFPLPSASSTLTTLKVQQYANPAVKLDLSNWPGRMP